MKLFSMVFNNNSIEGAQFWWMVITFFCQFKYLDYDPQLSAHKIQIACSKIKTWIGISIFHFFRSNQAWECSVFIRKCGIFDLQMLTSWDQCFKHTSEFWVGVGGGLHLVKDWNHKTFPHSEAKKFSRAYRRSFMFF